MLKRTIPAILTVMMVAGTVSAQRITESLTNWTMGTNQPQISSGTRGDGSTGDYLYLPVGTSPTYYEVETEGEGAVEFWIHDPGNCLDSINPGYSTRGCGWGMQNPLYQSAYVAVDRASYVSGCRGYSPWSTVAPYSPYWFSSGVRDGGYVGGWYKWTVTGTWDDITFVYDERISKTYNATTPSSDWEALFGEGWKAFIVKGDGATGIEDIGVDVTNGTGIFAEYSTSVDRIYERAAWSDIKRQFR